MPTKTKSAPVEDEPAEGDVDAFEEDDLIAADDATIARLTGSGPATTPAPVRFYASLLQQVCKRSGGGRVITTKWEASPENFRDLLGEPLGYMVTFDQLYWGEGATIESITIPKVPEGTHRLLRFDLAFPESEVRRLTNEHISQVGGPAGVLNLEPMQQSLRLDDGTEVDLTSRAE